MKLFQQDLKIFYKNKLFRQSQLFFEINQAVNIFFGQNFLEQDEKSKEKQANQNTKQNNLAEFKLIVKEEGYLKIILEPKNKTVSTWLKIQNDELKNVITNHLSQKSLLLNDSQIQLFIK